MQKDITIIIPTFKRHKILQKFLKYWKKQNVNVIIVDGSPRSLFGNLKVKRFENICYYHLPKSLEERLCFVSHKITGKYAALISDDEIFLASGLFEACKVLRQDNKIGSVLGATLAFKKRNSKVLFKIEYESILDLKIKSAAWEKRIDERFYVTGNSVVYSLVRAEILKHALAFIGEHKYSCPFIAEYQMEVFLAAAAPIKVIPTLMWLRNRNDESTKAFTYNRKAFFHKWIKDPKKSKEINLLKTSFLETFRFILNKNISSTQQLLEKITDFEERSLGVSHKKKTLNKICEIILHLFKNISRSNKKDTKPFFWQSLEDVYKDLKYLKIKFHPKELKKIKVYLQHFLKNETEKKKKHE